MNAPTNQTSVVNLCVGQTLKRLKQTALGGILIVAGAARGHKTVRARPLYLNRLALNGLKSRRTTHQPLTPGPMISHQT